MRSQRYLHKNDVSDPRLAPGPGHRLSLSTALATVLSVGAIKMSGMSTGVFNISRTCGLGMSGVLASPLIDRAQTRPVTVEQTRLDGVLEGWKRELQKKILFAEDEPRDFLKRFVPSNAPAIPNYDTDDLFSAWIPEKGKEVESYEGLVRCFWALFASPFLIGG